LPSICFLYSFRLYILYSAKFMVCIHIAWCSPTSDVTTLSVLMACVFSRLLNVQCHYSICDLAGSSACPDVICFQTLTLAFDTVIVYVCIHDNIIFAFLFTALTLYSTIMYFIIRIYHYIIMHACPLARPLQPFVSDVFIHYMNHLTLFY